MKSRSIMCLAALTFGGLSAGFSYAATPMEIARAEYELKNYVTAQDAFRQFLRLHPTHKHVRNGWVPYMVAVAAYMASPNSVPFLPPSRPAIFPSARPTAVTEVTNILPSALARCLTSCR